MRSSFRTLGVGFALLAASSASHAADAPRPDKTMRREDRMILAAAILGSLASVGVGAWVHWKLLRGPSKPKDGG
jgi:hypothetical protein